MQTIKSKPPSADSNASFFENKSMVDLYHTFFYPHLIYGIEFWGHASKTDLKQIFVLQKVALRVLIYVKPGKHVT